jgi:hypothetical protein
MCTSCAKVAAAVPTSTELLALPERLLSSGCYLQPGNPWLQSCVSLRVLLVVLHVLLCLTFSPLISGTCRLPLFKFSILRLAASADGKLASDRQAQQASSTNTDLTAMLIEKLRATSGRDWPANATTAAKCDLAEWAPALLFLRRCSKPLYV